MVKKIAVIVLVALIGANAAVYSTSRSGKKSGAHYGSRLGKKGGPSQKSDSVIEVTDMAQFNTVKSGNFVVMKIYATWCSVCMAMKPIFYSVAKSHAKKCSFAIVDIDVVPDVKGAFGITGVPTFVFFKNGSEVGRIVGKVTPGAIKAKMKELFGF